MASARREGFERVLSSVALGEVGIVGSREVSRLSRTDKDWCRLLEVCQIFGTLIADEQQIYDLNYSMTSWSWVSKVLLAWWN
jgi:DNA invertase Pin-like site-specific DNA recombinase